MSRSRGAGPSLSVRPLWSPCTWVIDTHGREQYEAICERAGVDPAVPLDASKWVTQESAVALLASVRALCASEAEFLIAAAHRIREGYGPLVWILPLATPPILFRAMARTVHLFSDVSRCEFGASSRTQVILRFHSDAPALESRELCLTRVAATSEVPRLLGLPPALLEERACMARGDPCCEYHLRFYARNRWLPIASGAAIGGAAAYGLALAGVDPSLGLASLPVVLALAAALRELRRTSAANVAHGLSVQSALEALARDESEARREIVAFHQRQREWGRLMEEQVRERTAQLEELLERVQQYGEARLSTLVGVSHDLQGPVHIMRLSHDLLRQELRVRSPLTEEALADTDAGIASIERLVKEFRRSVGPDHALIPLAPEPMEIAPWVDVLRRRVQALAFGKPLSVSVFRRREAPERIVTDRLVFERVADNLCSNAAKYTARGSIVIEIDGKPGFLTLKVSDTGFGIEPDRIARIFEPGRPDPRAERSLGVGLSVVVQLLAQIGGKLEVMSKLDAGTTFWAHFPLEPPAGTSAPPRPAPPRLADVVTIRKLHER